MRKDIMILLGLAIIIVVFAVFNPTGQFGRGPENGTIEMIYPNGGETLSDTITINAQCQFCEIDYTADFYYAYSNTEVPIQLGIAYDNGEFNADWDTTTAPDGESYKIHAYLKLPNNLIIDNDYSDENFIIKNIAEIDLCSDSDGGINIWEKGLCQDTSICTEETCEDVCKGTTTVIEYYCNSASGVGSEMTCLFKPMLCQIGEECIDGACIGPQ